MGQEDGDYINCPLNKEEYEAFVEAVLAAPKIQLKEFEKELERYFEGCMPIEVLAGRGTMSLAFGPMRPVGLRDPRTDRRPYAVVQLRQDNVAGTLYNMVGFQTNLRWGPQEEVLRLIPGLREAEFVRLGQMHRNTFVNSPTILHPTLQCQTRPDLFFAGQITGTEGYVGSTMGGLTGGNQRCPLSARSTHARATAHDDDRRAAPLHNPRRTGQLPAHEGQYGAAACDGRTNTRQGESLCRVCRPCTA